MPNNLTGYTYGSIDEKICKENERLIGENEADYSRSFRRQILANFLASLMSFSSGTVIAGWTPSATNRWPLSDGDDLAVWSAEQESWIVSTYVIGALVGALPAGYLSQTYGRKVFLLYLAVPMTVGWIVCLLKLNCLWMECLGRFVSGLSLGATTVAVPLYASDVSSDVLRGRAGVFLDFMLCAGIQYAYVARTTLPSLRLFCVACAAVPVAFAVLFSRMPESPVYLYTNGRPERAAAELRWLRGRRFDVKQEFVRMEQSKRQEKESPESDRRFLVRVWFLSFGLVLAQRMSGAGGVIQYSGVLFDMAGATINTNVSCIVVGAFQLVASGASFLLVDKVGRRTLLLVSSAVVTACLALLVVYFDWLIAGTLDGRPWKTLSLLCVLCTFIVAFRLGLGPIPWFVATELTPADRGGGLIQSASSSFSWFLSFVIMKTFKTLVQQYPVQLWTTFAGMSAVGFAFIALCVPETNNKSRQQIRADMMGRAHDGVAC